jgi:hypothetical protein
LILVSPLPTFLEGTGAAAGRGDADVSIAGGAAMTMDLAAPVTPDVAPGQATAPVPFQQTDIAAAAMQG